MWVRGLKLNKIKVFANREYVASYVGAWIETWVEGSVGSEASSRILCGCVD